MLRRLADFIASRVERAVLDRLNHVLDAIEERFNVAAERITRGEAGRVLRENRVPHRRAADAGSSNGVRDDESPLATKIRIRGHRGF